MYGNTLAVAFAARRCPVVPRNARPIVTNAKFFIQGAENMYHTHAIGFYTANISARFHVARATHVYANNLVVKFVVTVAAMLNARVHAILALSNVNGLVYTIVVQCLADLRVRDYPVMSSAQTSSNAAILALPYVASLAINNFVHNVLPQIKRIKLLISSWALNWKRLIQKEVASTPS